MHQHQVHNMSWDEFTVLSYYHAFTYIILSSALPDSPIWSSGSGAIKEIRLHEAEMKVSLSLALQCSRLIS